MKESTLKKEFSQHDVQRMRNLIKGKFEDKTRIQSGYTKKSNAYVEGDVWEENGKTWTIKDGIKQTITKFDSLKELVVLPLTCPNCKKPLKNTDHNKKMYSIHKMCFDCVIEMEMNLRKEGKYEEYEKTMMSSNRDALVEDLEKALQDWLVSKDTFITEQGDVEEWSESKGKQEVYEEAKKVLDNIKNLEL